MSTLQLLIEDEGNRAAVRSLLEGRYDVRTDQTVREADCYLVDDHTFPRHHAALRDRVEESDPLFCPVVLLRRDDHGGQLSLPEPDERDGPLVVDDVVSAPIDRALLVRRLNTLLVRRQQSQKLRRYVSKLEDSNDRLEQFAYAASHDLQEPLRMVSSYLQLLERRYGDEFDEDGQEFLAYAVDGADRMREMIDALLAYSRVDTEGESLEPTDLDAVLEDVRDDLRMKIEETGAAITVEELPTVDGDPAQLRQLFQNLLDNALEYSGEGPPEIRVGAEQNGTEWIVSVTDDGIGIDPDDQERIFEVFQRLHSHEEHGGTGIGLALCERIAERHGGEIRVDAEPGEGSTFEATFPVHDSDDSDT